MAIVYRSADWDTPWRVGPNRGAGRYNRAGSDPTQYLSEHPLAVFAERLRSLGRAAVADLETIRWRCWAMEVRTDDLTVIDLDAAPAYGITPEELVGDDWGPCQELADRRRAAGDRGLIIPSAALPGTKNIVLFEPRVASPFLLPAVDPAVDSPTAHTAEQSVAPSEVVPLVRWIGDPHSGLVAWRHGHDAPFVDPTPTRS